MAMGAFHELWISQSGRCAICGEAMPMGRFNVAHATIWKKRRPTIDHIRPRTKGGTDDRANLQLAHAECNWRKGSACIRGSVTIKLQLPRA